MKHLKGYKLYESNSSDPTIQTIKDYLLDLEDIGAEVSVDTWVIEKEDGNTFICRSGDEYSDDEKAYHVFINKSIKLSGDLASVFDTDYDRDGDVVGEADVDYIISLGKVMTDVANFVSMSKGEGWKVFMDDSNITSRSISIGFFILPNRK